MSGFIMFKFNVKAGLLIAKTKCCYKAVLIQHQLCNFSSLIMQQLHVWMPSWTIFILLRMCLTSKRRSCLSLVSRCQKTRSSASQTRWTRRSVRSVNTSSSLCWRLAEALPCTSSARRPKVSIDFAVRGVVVTSRTSWSLCSRSCPAKLVSCSSGVSFGPPTTTKHV